MTSHGLTPDSFSWKSSGGDNVSQQAIDQAVDAVRRLCGWHVWPQVEETLTIDTPGDPVVFLPTKHVTDVLEVKIDGQAVALESVSWSADGMLCLHTVPRGFRRVSATVVHGYANPAELVGVVGDMAIRASSVSTSYSVGGISVGGAAGATPQSSEWRIIDMFKLGPMP